MRADKLPKTLSVIVAIILALVPFHAFLTVYLSSLVGHYTLLRLWKEFLLLILAAGSAWLLINDGNLRRKFFASRLNQLITVYCLVSVVWGFGAYFLNQVTLKALGFGLIVNLRFLVFFLTVQIIATKSQLLQRIWPKLLLIPAAIVIFLGLTQRLLLPYDFLKHFGYNSSTIFPYETINHNVRYPRIMSTLRGANPLGAYLVLITTTLAAYFTKDRKKRWLWAVLGAAGFLTLAFSYSRAAWIGAFVSLLFLIWMSLKSQQLKKVLLVGFVGFVIVTGALAVVLHNNATFENVFLHTQKGSAIKTTSDQSHTSAFKDGLRDIVHEPVGKGTGTAGPASVYNAGNVRIAENYFIQIGQEVGWLGLALFLAVNYFVARDLWLRRGNILASILLASLIGISIVNLFSHAWTDDTLAYLWWGLAGIALTI